MATSPEEFIDDYKDALLRVDGAALAAMYHDDAILISPSMGVVAEGREQIDAAWSAITAMVEEAVSFEIVRRDVIETGQYAICHIEARAVARLSGVEDPVETNIRATEVLRRDTAGHYRYLIDHGS